MKKTKNLFLSLIILTTLSSFGLINHADLLKSQTIEVSKSDSLQKLNSVKNASQLNIKPIDDKQFNKQKQEEEQSEKGSFLLKISHFILLGFKTILKFALKLYSL